MGQYSFDIKDSQGLFNKLKKDFENFIADKLSSDSAVNFSITAYHLFEWTELELKPDQKEKFKKEKQIIEEDYHIIRDITNGTKHKDITKYVPRLKEAKKHNGAFSSGFSRGFDISVLLVELKDGRELYFEDIVDRVFKFWDNHFKTKIE